jgi:hypothetical protein
MFLIQADRVLKDGVYIMAAAPRLLDGFSFKNGVDVSETSPL